MSVNFFGVQIALLAPPGDPLRAALHAAVRAFPGDQTLAEKRAFHDGVARALEAHVGRWRFGTWDYLTGDDAQAAFDEWTAGLERSADENPGDAKDDDHIVATLVYLLDVGSDADATVAERCDLPESTWHDRATYSRLIATTRMLAYVGVRADGAYVVPGEGGPGLAAAELTGAGWDYLQPMR
jgi:hypothetical protein